MAAKTFPDFSDSDYRGPRSKLCALREFVLNHDGPVAPEDARRLMAATLGITIDLIAETHSPSKYDMDWNEAERLLRGEIAMYERSST